jgi:hypothetical protein
VIGKILSPDLLSTHENDLGKAPGRGLPGSIDIAVLDTVDKEHPVKEDDPGNKERLYARSNP